MMKKATTLLKADHSALKKLFSAYEKADKADDNTRKRTLFDQIAADLDVHAKIEEEIFYPAMKATAEEEAVDEVLVAIEEHGVVKSLLAQLKEMKLEDETFDAKMTVLIAAVEHHAGEEEDEMFPEAEKKLGKPKLRELGARIEERKAELKGVAAPPEKRASR